MIARFISFNSRISSGIPGASLEFEDFKSLEIANAIRGLEVIYSIRHQIHSADVNGQESKRANALMVQMGHQVTGEHEDNMKQLIQRYLIQRLSSEMPRLTLVLAMLLFFYDAATTKWI